MSWSPSHGALRATRAAVLTVPAVASASAGHVAAGECVTATAVLLSAGALWPTAVALLGRRRSTGVLWAWLGLGQVLTHALLAWTCATPHGGEHQQGGAGMLLAHLAAGLVCAALVGRADAGLWTAHLLLRALCRLRLPRLVAAAPAARVRHLVTPLTRAPQPRVAVEPWRRRGPPAPSFA